MCEVHCEPTGGEDKSEPNNGLKAEKVHPEANRTKYFCVTSPAAVESVHGIEPKVS
jgi:hypothetical protein